MALRAVTWGPRRRLSLRPTATSAGVTKLLIQHGPERRADGLALLVASHDERLIGAAERVVPLR